MFKRKTINEYKDTPKENLIIWIRQLIKSMLVDLNIEDTDFVKVNKLMNAYMKDFLSMAEIRKEAFSFHKKARFSTDLKEQLIYRIYGQTLSIIHVKTHAFHAANYITKLYKLYQKDTKIVYDDQLKKLESAYQVTYKKLDDII